MAPPFLISYETTDPFAIRLGSLYWKYDNDGIWSHTVSEIAEYLAIASHEVSGSVGNYTPAFVLSRRCSECGFPFRVRNRTELSALEKDKREICQACREEESRIAAAHREELVRREREAVRKEMLAGEEIRARVTETLPRINYYSASYEDIIYSFTLFNCSDIDGDLQARPYAVPPFAPTEIASRDVMVHLHNSGILHFGKRTPADAFIPNAEGTGFRYFPQKACWRFARDIGSEPLSKVLGSRIDEPLDDDELWSGVKNIWWRVARSESKRYLSEQLDRYGLHVNEGEALDTAVDHALERYSIPCLRNLLWQVAKDAAAYSARVDVVRPQAINSIPGAIVRKVDRALAGGWTVNPYVRKWDDEECALITTLFDRVLKSGRDGFGSLTGKLIDVNLAEAGALASSNLSQ